MSTIRVSFGYRQVTPEEKRRLVNAQFDPIALTYDLADAILSAGLDSRWRKAGVRLLDVRKGELVLDACGGTGRFAVLAAGRAGGEGLAVVYDFNRAMIEAGRAKVWGSFRRGNISSIQGDAEKISFRDAAFDAVTVGFGIRNFVHLEEGLKEIHRVLKPGGKLLVLEFSLPSPGWGRALYHFYSFRIMPLVARIICGTGGPFRYLAESIRVFPPADQVAELLRSLGFSGVFFRRLSGGLAVLYSARKSGNGN
jgi:demethylmenaquinone methyltransferase/2-methoxy-6-polyprenyl-1,4-benzoquinol methylase